MARATLAKAFGLKRGAWADTTWQPLPIPMLQLLVEIADAETRLEAHAAKLAANGHAAAPAPGGDPTSSA
jgi:hypothetical protein